MHNNDRVGTLVQGVIDANLRSVPRSYQQRTDSCLSLSLLVEIAEQEIDGALAVHAAGCAYCRTTLRTARADHWEAYNGWACVEVAIHAARTNRALSRLDEMYSFRGAHAFLAARDELRNHPFPKDIRDRLEGDATVLAQILFDRDHEIADGLLGVVHGLRNGPRGAGKEATSELQAIMSSLTLKWANRRDASNDPIDLRVARELFLTVGERSRAVLCSMRTAALLYQNHTYEEARIEYARAVFDADDGRTLADALAAVGRTSVFLKDTTLAIASLTAAEEVYHSIGDPLAVKDIFAERMSLIPHAKQSPAPRRAATKASG
jgi:hypothetical protein